VIVFHSLSEEHLKRIVEIQLERLRARLADRHITLQLTDSARENLVATGYDPHYGARPLKRAIQKKVETPMGRLLLQGAIRDGQTVIVEADGRSGDLRFVAEPVAAR
jgi:ATP-dependent Clp protease ATP-binding subunit ClpB